MKSYKLILILLLLFKIEQIKGQNEVLSCVYNVNSNNDYGCDLTIINPNRLNNFQDISGVHISGKTDSDVVYANFNSASNSTNIPSIICAKFKNLENLGFDNDCVKEINDYYFTNCKNFKYLSFGGYTINKVYKNAFIENIQLQSLSFYRCELTDLPANVFPKLGNNLTTIDLSYNKLKTVKPGWFQSLTNLETVSFYQNLIEEIPVNTFINCKSLKSVNMMFNKLKVLSSKSFYDIFKLDNFNFFENQLLAIDEKFTVHPYFSFNNYLFTSNWCIIEKPHKITTVDDYAVCFENFQSWETGMKIFFNN